MIPLAETLRIRLDPASVMYKLPARSTATAAGGDNTALAAGPPSPSGKQKIWPAQLMPATVVMVPPGETLRTRELLVSAMNTLPAASTATPAGFASCALVAGPPSPE